MVCTSAEAKFELQRSTDGLNYMPLYAFSANRDRCENPFNFTDAAPADGKNYYRLKLIDIDEKLNYSNIVLLVQKSGRFDLMSIYPNVVRNETAVLKIDAYENGTITLVISDYTGRIIQRQNVSVQSGLNQIPLQTNSLTAGVYNVTAYSNNARPKTLKLVKQ